MSNTAQLINKIIGPVEFVKAYVDSRELGPYSSALNDGLLALERDTEAADQLRFDVEAFAPQTELVQVATL